MPNSLKKQILEKDLTWEQTSTQILIDDRFIMSWWYAMVTNDINQSSGAPKTGIFVFIFALLRPTWIVDTSLGSHSENQWLEAFNGLVSRTVKPPMLRRSGDHEPRAEKILLEEGRGVRREISERLLFPRGGRRAPFSLVCRVVGNQVSVWRTFWNRSCSVREDDALSASQLHISRQVQRKAFYRRGFHSWTEVELIYTYD